MGFASSSLQFLLILSSSLALATSSDYDFSYMKVVQYATELPAEEEYDYIVVGGGTAGCPLATTLSEKHSVLVLERGNAPKAHPNVLSASGVLANLMEKEDNTRDTPAQRFTSEDGVANVRGRVLGGTSMINAGFFSRAEEEYFHANPEVEWDMEAVEEAYQWVEEAIVSLPKSLAVWQSVVKEALLEAGVVPDNSITLDHKIGTKFSGSTFDELGRRHGAVELLNKGNFKNLRVAIHATVQRIIFSTKASNRSAIGVIYTDSKGKSHRATVRPKGEVILSAGALGSPQLLLLSGIGSAAELASQHIRLVHSQPNVGKFMADNPRNNIHLVLPFPFEGSSAQVVGITKDYYIETLSYDLGFTPTPLPFSFFDIGDWSANISMASIVAKPPGPLSNGSLRLASPTDPKAQPRVRFNYFTHPKDLARCVAAMRKVGDMLETESLDRFKYTDFNGKRGFMFLGASLPANRSDRAAMEAFCRSSVTTYWHYHGGCLVGKVVDGGFRVFGVESLRVIDGSTFNLSPGTNPQATVMMLGRYMGLKIQKERSE